MTTTLHHYINGRRVAGARGRFGDVFNPATGAIAARVPLASRAETEQAIAAAAAAFPAWRDTPPLRRARVLFRFKELLDAHLDELAQLVAREHGKVLSDARGSVIRGIEVAEFACGAPHLGQEATIVSRQLPSASFLSSAAILAWAQTSSVDRLA
jgi:malonate-semialdehyde dehydrogenase (acetylating)/methylmalonate-semialdehyde dehydrogenase